MGCNCSPLPRRFFLDPPTLVAPALLGKLLVRRAGGRTRWARIVETEAYLGQDDPAAHAAAGLTPRTAVLFGDPGRAYIYLIYGLHLCLNVSTLPAGEAGGVLFRAAAEAGAPDRALSGPGRLTHHLGIPASLNGCDLTRPGALYLADDGFPPAVIAVTPRVGIRKARELPYRYLLEGHPAVSSAREPVVARFMADAGKPPIASLLPTRVYSGIS